MKPAKVILICLALFSFLFCFFYFLVGLAIRETLWVTVIITVFCIMCAFVAFASEYFFGDKN